MAISWGGYLTIIGVRVRAGVENTVSPANPSPNILPWIIGDPDVAAEAGMKGWARIPIWRMTSAVT